jgi:hypothetical protein
MLALFRLPPIVMPTVGALVVASLLLMTQGATAQSATGTVTGRVLWGPCVRGIPLPLAPDAQGQPQTQPPVGAPSTTINGLPAGAVLVAVQNTGVSARTDEAGRFLLAGVPAGQYLTVAAGPVANSLSASAARPNVFLNAGDSVDIGTLPLGGPTPFGIACRPALGAPGETAVPGAADTGPAIAPNPENPPANTPNPENP